MDSGQLKIFIIILITFFVANLIFLIELNISTMIGVFFAALLESSIAYIILLIIIYIINLNK